MKKITLAGLRDDQAEIVLHPARIKVVACGRKWGKTTTAMFYVTKKALEKERQLIWWVMPSYNQCKEVIDEYERLFGGADIYKKVKRRPDHEIIYPNGSIVKFKSTDRADLLRGANPHVVVIDEARDVEDRAWYEVIRPNLMARRGSALIISTPLPDTWFEKEYLEGLEGKNDKKSWNKPTWTNPLAAEEALKLKDELPELVWKQEIAAEFVSAQANVFRNLEKVVEEYEIPILPKSEMFYYMGVDLAVHQDYTAIVVIDSKGVVVYVDAFKNITWDATEKRVLEVAKLYDARVLIDSTGVGDPIYERLSERLSKIEAFKFTNESKKMLIEQLAVTIMNMEIKIPRHAELLKQLGVYRIEITGKNKITYNAPAGKHDDLVIALALANKLYQERRRAVVASYHTSKIILPF